MSLRRVLTVVLLCVLTAAAVLPGSASASVSPEEWRWMVAAGEKEQAGDVEGAMEYWRLLVESLRTHNVDACGNYARKLGRAQDERGRYTEAAAAFEILQECWSQLTDPSYAEGMLPDMRRLEQIRPEVRTFVARPAANQPVFGLAKHEPAYGTLLGGTLDADRSVGSDPDRVPLKYGKPYAIALIYATWNQYPQHVAKTFLWEKSGALQVAWEPDQGLAAVKDNAYVRGVARQLREYGRPVYLRFAGEMNGAWVAWHGDPALYREKFRLVAGIMREEAPNVAMVWSPNYVGDAPMDDYYPGDEWVDWIGINAYHDPYFVGKTTSLQKDADIFYQGKRTNPLDKVKAIYQRYAARKPIMLAETGFGWANRTPFIDESQWASEAMERFHSYLPLLYPRLKAISYFNVDYTLKDVPGFSHYIISGSPLLTDTYKRVTGSNWYLGSVAASAPTFWRPVEQATMAGTTRVASYVNLVDGVGRVEYLVNGKVAATARQIPWEADLPLDSTSRSLMVRVYNKQGLLRIERTYNWDPAAIKVTLNGRYLDFDQPPVMLNSRVLVPARAILEALGAQIGWDAATQTVTAVKDGSVLRLQIGNTVPTRDGKPLKALDVPAQLISGRTLVPARFVSENYNMQVAWDQANWTVVITNKP